MDVLCALVVSLAVIRAIGARQLPELFMVSSTNSLRMTENQRPDASPSGTGVERDRQGADRA